ncbi:origin recognition complex subunit 4 C-terminus-domain-containing protein [Zychaea mexicana]|uniref:origin recognition complex subunit 4 C-terminus-domain-containing protein n=1 Tax=Zychaea mexicana TaxID=64656 RepID=UPI0022FE3C55|nr:origin recognition complex subunit 4 C-terminus-domain-containing protein [Zychaea mexicana]KAI9467860.1 origin recognition complex subunit 4 C-terminus-domain-containing protein [Zychaea mexicana]
MPEAFDWEALNKFFPPSPTRKSPHRSMKRSAPESPSQKRARLLTSTALNDNDDPFAAESTCTNNNNGSINNLRDHVELASSRLLAHISEQSVPAQLYGLDQEYEKLHDLLNQTVGMGESNSCLMIGNRGTGKTMLVRRVLDDLAREYNRGDQEGFCVIKLNGLIQSTDRLALNEIARQLFDRQQIGQQEQQQQSRRFASFAESFGYLLSLLKSGDKSTLPVIFILDEFDLFAQQPKQALLYNLFDAAQSAQNPMAVIGLTCRLDALLLLEKRVKSRFSHRQIYLFPPTEFDEFKELTKGALQLRTLITDTPGYGAYADKFNASVEELFKDTSIIGIIRRIFDLTKDIRMFYKICFEPISQLSEKEPYLSVNQFQETSIAQRSDSKTEILRGVSLLELILIVSMKKLLEKDINTFNFEMVYDEYKDFMNQTQVRGAGFGVRLYKRAVALKAFENLQGFELVCPVEEIAKCPKEYRMAKLMLEQSQVTEAVLKYKDCPSTIKRWVTG